MFPCLRADTTTANINNDALSSTQQQLSITSAAATVMPSSNMPIVGSTDAAAVGGGMPKIISSTPVAASLSLNSIQFSSAAQVQTGNVQHTPVVIASHPQQAVMTTAMKPQPILPSAGNFFRFGNPKIPLTRCDTPGGRLNNVVLHNPPQSTPTNVSAQLSLRKFNSRGGVKVGVIIFDVMGHPKQV